MYFLLVLILGEINYYLILLNIFHFHFLGSSFPNSPSDCGCHCVIEQLANWRHTRFDSLHGNSAEEEREQISLVWYSPLQLSTPLPHFYASFPPKETVNWFISNKSTRWPVATGQLSYLRVDAVWKIRFLWEPGCEMGKLWRSKKGMSDPPLRDNRSLLKVPRPINTHLFEKLVYIFFYNAQIVLKVFWPICCCFGSRTKSHNESSG